jgi:hypothetical protein
MATNVEIKAKLKDRWQDSAPCRQTAATFGIKLSSGRLTRLDRDPTISKSYE